MVYGGIREDSLDARYFAHISHRYSTFLTQPSVQEISENLVCLDRVSRPGDASMNRRHVSGYSFFPLKGKKG